MQHKIKKMLAKLKLSAWRYLVMATALFLPGCSKEENTPELAERVVIVYMGGDNNLSFETYQKIKALQKGWNSSLQGRLLIYNDPADEVPQLIEIYSDKQGVAVAEVRKTYNEENSADATVFASVLREIRTDYPATSYGLILFSHASGWLPEGTLTSPRSVVTNQKSEMELIDFANAIPDHTFNFIIFEACFMSGIEVVYELKDKTNYIVASSAEIVSPGFTHIYPDALACLFRQEADLTSFTQHAFSYFENLHNDSGSATFSVIRTAGLDILASYIKNAATGSAQNIEEIQYLDRYSSYHLFFDFLSYYRQILSDSQIKTVEQLISDCITFKVATPWFMPYSNGFMIKEHSGFTTYIKQARFPYLNREYEKLKWYNAIKHNR